MELSPPKTEKGAGRALAVGKAKVEPKPAKPDLIQEIKAPKTFRGVVIDLSAKKLDAVFSGIWVPSPHIAGSGSTIEWSSYSALIADLDEQERLTFAFGFNLGRRDGKLYARTFAWPKSSNEVVPVKDEGAVREADGGFVLDLDKRQVVLLPSEKPWVPTEAKLYRFIASVGTTPNQIPPQFNSLAVQNNSPRTVTFAGGSYLQLEDGPFVRVFFAPFGDHNLHQIRLFKQGDAWLADGPNRDLHSPIPSWGVAQFFLLNTSRITIASPPRSGDQNGCDEPSQRQSHRQHPGP